MNENFAGAYNRSPRWKWNRAYAIFKGDDVDTTPVRDTDNGYNWISRAVQFQHCMQIHTDPLKNNDLIILYGDIYTAHDLFTSPNVLFRAELEAMVLARMEEEEIAFETGIASSAIHAYKELFFDVASRLNQRSYILHFVIGPDIQKLDMNNHEVIWKLFAYFLGPLVLKALVSRTVNPRFCQSQDSVNASLKEDIIGSFNIACSIAAKAPNTADGASQRMLQLLPKFMEVDKMADMSTSGNQLLEHLQATLNGIHYTVGGKYGPDHPLKPYDKVPIEPTFEDFVELAATGHATKLEHSEHIQYPPSPKRGIK